MHCFCFFGDVGLLVMTRGTVEAPLRAKLRCLVVPRLSHLHAQIHLFNCVFLPVFPVVKLLPVPFVARKPRT